MQTAWMRMPGQTWLGAGASFLIMWCAMTAAMMLPSVAPVLWRYRRAAALSGAARAGCLTAWAVLGYFFVWTAVGLLAFPLGALLTAIELRQPMLARAEPIIGGLLVLIAGALQFTAWKSRQLRCCAQIPLQGHRLRTGVGDAWRGGMRLGLHCNYCCAGPTTLLFVLGVMDLRAMLVVAAAINAERLIPAHAAAARAIGCGIIAVGSYLLVRALFT